VNQVIAKDNIEEVDNVFLQMEQNNQTVSIDGVSHVYPTGKKAVNNLSFKMYQNQIFVLLGGNGAGIKF
jgi:ABC-type sugar transport system ATPase subunit